MTGHMKSCQNRQYQVDISLTKVTLVFDSLYKQTPCAMMGFISFNEDPEFPGCEGTFKNHSSHHLPTTSTVQIFPGAAIGNASFVLYKFWTYGCHPHSRHF